MADNPGNFLIEGLPIVLIVKNKPFQGIITKKEDNRLLVRLLHPDPSVLSIMLDSKLQVRYISDEGLAYSFECNLLGRKIPHITLKYPSIELDGVNVRKNPRIPVSFWTAIQEPCGNGKFKDTGDGNIADLSEGGCRIMTGNKYNVNDPIYLSFEYQEGKDRMRFKGKIRQIRKAPHDLIYYGIKFDEASPEFLKIIKAIIQNPQL